MKMLKRYFRFGLYLAVLIALSTAKAGVYEDFFQAVKEDDARAVASLLSRGFDPNARDEKGQVALYLSQRDAAFKVADLLLSQPQTGIDLANAAGETALMMASLRGHVDWMVRLLDKGARIEGPANGERPGWTPLHYAASSPAPAAVNLLLARGARVDARSPNGSTPLMLAAQYGAEDSVGALLKQGADARLHNDLGLVAADFARRAGREALAASLSAAAR